MTTRVLIVTYYWPPSGGAGVQRYLKFAKYLPHYDIEPVILTVENPTYPIQDPTLKEDIPDNIQVFKSKTIEPFRFYAGLSGKKAEDIKPTVELEGGNLVSRLGSWFRANLFVPDARSGWLLTARKKAEKLVRSLNISVVITTGPPHSVHFIGKYVQERTGIQWLADFRDPWTGIYYNQVLPRTTLVEHFDKKLETSILKKADQVIVVSHSQAEQFREIEERAYHVITNGFDPEDFKNSGSTPRQPPPFIIRHIGTLGEAAVPETFLNVIKKISTRLDVRVEFIGNVHNKLHELVDKLELEDTVFFSDYLPHREAIEKMCSSHILLLLVPEVKQNEHHIPGKLFEYLGSGRPILLLGPDSGDAHRIIEEQDAGICCSFHDETAIHDAIQLLCSQTESQDPKQSDENHPYSRKHLTGKLSELIRQQKD